MFLLPKRIHRRRQHESNDRRLEANTHEVPSLLLIGWANYHVVWRSGSGSVVSIILATSFCNIISCESL